MKQKNMSDFFIGIVLIIASVVFFLLYYKPDLFQHNHFLTQLVITLYSVAIFVIGLTYFKNR